MKHLSILLGFFALVSLLPAAPCCAVPATPGADETGVTLSPESLYQLDARFVTDSGQPFALADLRGRPVVITMFFASCTYACPMLISDMTRVRDALPADIREEAVLVLVSFDVERDTPEALKQFRTERLLNDSWLLLSTDEAGVRELAALLGIKFKREASGQYAHSNILTVLNREGERVHQRNGLTGGLAETAAAVVAAAAR